MELLVIKHSPTDHVGLIEEMPFDVKVHHADVEPKMPKLRKTAGLIVMGGPQAAYTDDGFASRRNEIKLIREAIADGIPVLGICLGSQLLAVATGGSGYRRDEAEIGWSPVTLTAAGRRDPIFKGCATSFLPRHNHHDSFKLPPGAVRLASSDACLEQSFRLGNLAWGVQFHFEMKLDTKTDWATGRSDDTLIDVELARHITDLAPTARQILANFSSIIQKTSSCTHRGTDHASTSRKRQYGPVHGSSMAAQQARN